MRNISERALRVLISKIYPKDWDWNRQQGSGYFGIHGTPTEILAIIDLFKATPSGNYYGDMEYIKNMYRNGESRPVNFSFHCSSKLFKKVLTRHDQ